MSEPIFLAPEVRLSLAELVALTGAEVAAAADLSACIRGVAALDEAERGDISFLADARLVGRLESTRATACFISGRYSSRVPETCLPLVTEHPDLAFALVLAALFPQSSRPGSIFGAAGANPGAIIHPDARLESGVIVDPGVVIGPRAEIGSGSIIGAGSVIGPDVRIGRDSSIGAQVTLTHALIGNRVVLHPGARVGQDGSAFAIGPGGVSKVPQVRRVIVQDDVEVGANATIDRGSARDTVIGEGAKVGHLVQIGEGVTIGRHCVIAAQAGIASEVRLGDFVVVGARASLAPNVMVGAGVEIAAGSFVGTDVPTGPRAGG